MFPTHFESQKDGDFIFAQIETQGWRDYMEDQILIQKIINHNGEADDLFCVFDGHGGALVALFCKITLP